MNKQCIICGKEFEAHKSNFERRKTCGKECVNILKSRITKGRPKSEEHKRRIGLGNIGKRLGCKASDETRKKLSESHKGIVKNPEWRRKIGASQSGEKGNNWRGGRTIQRKLIPVKYIKCPGHPKANNSGYVREYTYIMEKHIGRLLNEGEVVHHINGDHTDNRIENLMLFSSTSDHIKHHTTKHRHGD